MAEKYDPVITENDATKTTAFVIETAKGMLIDSNADIKGDFSVEILFHGIRQTTIKIETIYKKSMLREV